MGLGTSGGGQSTYGLEVFFGEGVEGGVIVGGEGSFATGSYLKSSSSLVILEGLFPSTE